MRAKFKCDKVDITHVDDFEKDAKGEYIKDADGKFVAQGKLKYSETMWFTAVYSPDPKHPNHVWSLYTPAGQVNIQVTNPECFGHFEAGKEYYLDFNPAE